MSFSSQVIALNSKVAGKDKIYRTLQYGCKLFWYILWKNKSNKEYIEILKKIEASMSSTRRVLRLFKSHDMIEAMLKSIKIDDDFLRYVLTSSHINQACYLALDNLVWMNSVGLVHLDNAKSKKISEWSNKFWLFGTLLYLARDLNEILNLIRYHQEKKDFNPANKYVLNETSGAYTSSIKAKRNIRSLVLRLLQTLTRIVTNKNNHPLLLDTLKNAFDIVLPMSNANYINVTPGVQGFCGLMSSLIALLIVWNAKYKLSP